MMKDQSITEITATSSLVERRVTFTRRNCGSHTYRNLKRTSTQRIENLFNDHRDEIDIIFMPLALMVTWYKGGV